MVRSIFLALVLIAFPAWAGDTPHPIPVPLASSPQSAAPDEGQDEEAAAQEEEEEIGPDEPEEEQAPSVQPAVPVATPAPVVAKARYCGGASGPNFYHNRPLTIDNKHVTTDAWRSPYRPTRSSSNA